jgi:aspartyl-tRNA(Asn)/glutamyl-tRNA(Gln) amidotransferase subunit C
MAIETLFQELKQLFCIKSDPEMNPSGAASPFLQSACTRWGLRIKRRAMSAPSIDIHHVAKLARLSLTDEEAALYQQQLSRVLAHIDQLSAHDLAAEPSAHALPVFDVVRADVARPGLSQAAALQNAPRQAMDQFQIPKVIE